MKALLSILLGLILLTSLVGISYAQNSGDNCGQLSPSNPNYGLMGCHGNSHVGGSADPPHHHCGFIDEKTDTACCPLGITPRSLEVSGFQADHPPLGCS